MERSYNTRCPAVKRLLREAQELHKPTEEYFAQPLEDNLFEWHFTLRGPVNTDFGEGIYHGRIILPSEYPMKPPDIIFLTHNGRFETNKKICLSISAYHPESWRPSWSIRTALLAIIGYMPSSGLGTIAGLQYTSQERLTLAKKSHRFVCEVCGPVTSLLLPRTSENAQEISNEAQKISREMAVTEKPLTNGNSKTETDNAVPTSASNPPSTNAPVSSTTSPSATALPSSPSKSVHPCTKTSESSDIQNANTSAAGGINVGVQVEAVAPSVSSVTSPAETTTVDRKDDTDPSVLTQRVGTSASVSRSTTESAANAAQDVNRTNPTKSAPLSESTQSRGNVASSTAPPVASRDAGERRALHRPNRAVPACRSDDREIFNVLISALLVVSVSMLTILILRRLFLLPHDEEESDEFFPIDHEEILYNT